MPVIELRSPQGWRRLLTVAAGAWLTGWYFANRWVIDIWLRSLFATPSTTCRDVYVVTDQHYALCQNATIGGNIAAYLEGRQGNFLRYADTLNYSSVWLWFAVPIALAASYFIVPWIAKGFITDRS